ncbi:MAG: response regulator [Bacteroidales bacterium]|nr:response regulator [Bacteroidales bacterium]
MKNHFLIILFFLAVINTEQLLALSGNVIIEDYSYKDGLKTSWVHNIYQDSKGFIWICSNNGLFRYDSYHFRNVNELVKDFFFDQETYSIIEDQENNFIIGTKNGAYYYNTRLEKIFRLQISFDKSYRVFNLLLNKNDLWLATSKGLFQISRVKAFAPEDSIEINVFLPDSLNQRSAHDNIINALYCSPEKSSLWVGTNGALYEMDLKTRILSPIESYTQNSIRGLSGYNGHILASSWDGGVFVVNSATRKLQGDPMISYVNSILGDKRVVTAKQDSQKRLWVATFDNGLYLFTQSAAGKFSYVKYRNDRDPQGSLKSNFINHMFIDNSGIVWLGQIQPALSKLYFQKNKLIHVDLYEQYANFELGEIRSVSRSSAPDKLWITTNGSGLLLFDAKSQQIIQYTANSTRGLQLPGNKINLCYQDNKGNLWLVFQRLGLYVVPSDVVSDLLEGTVTNTVMPVVANMLVNKDSEENSYILSIFMDSSDRLWFGGWGKLHVVELRDEFLTSGEGTGSISKSITTSVLTRDVFRKNNMTVSPVSSIIGKTENTIMLATLGAGIVEVEVTSKNQFSIKHPEVNKKMLINSMKGIFTGRGNNVWISTRAGLYLWNTDSDSIELFTSKEGLCSDDISSIAEDHQGNIWVSTSYGISRISSSDNSISNFFYPGNDRFNQYIVNAVVSLPDNRIGFSTNESILLFQPDSMETEYHDPPLYFTDIKIDNRPVIPLEKYFGTQVIECNINECKVVRVPYNHTLSIDFAAIDFVSSDRILYKYRFGDKNEWIVLNANQRNLFFPRMKQGEYTLTIMLVNSQNQVARSLVIKYLPPIWLTVPAYIAYFLIAMSLFLIYRRFLVQKIQQQAILENERFERKKIEELEKKKSEFFSNLSHEFRTPLSLIINPLDALVKEPDLSQATKDKLDVVLKSSNRLLKLTNELMDSGQVKRQLLTPDYHDCDVVTLIHDSCQLFNNFADSMNLDFKVSGSPERLEVPVDKGMIEKVMFNLLSNAFKYTPAKGMIMVKYALIREADKDYAKISVINTGDGIQEKDIKRIFDRFYQADILQNMNMQGSGIGLSMVKNFVELHNGKVEVTSEPGLETCFNVYLPMVQMGYRHPGESDDSGGVKLKDNLPKKETGGQPSKSDARYTLLVIEDEKEIRNYIAKELSDEFAVSVAPDGVTGLRLAGEMVPDLIIADIRMPGISGLELCKVLKNQMITSHIPIIILSAKVSVDEQIEGLETGADVYMVKPFSVNHLKAQIHSLITFKQSIFTRNLKETSLIPQEALTSKLDEEFMRKVTFFIESNLTDSGLSVDQLAQCVSLSKVQTYRKIKAISGLSIVEFIRAIRLKKAAQMILEKQMSFSEISFEMGFSTPSYFSKCFHDHFGKTPSEYATDNGRKSRL